VSFLTGKIGREELDELVDGWLVGAGDGKRLSQYFSYRSLRRSVWVRELDGMDGRMEGGVKAFLRAASERGGRAFGSIFREEGASMFSELQACCLWMDVHWACAVWSLTEFGKRLVGRR
jgi:hypothetical protein